MSFRLPEHRQITGLGSDCPRHTAKRGVDVLMMPCALGDIPVS